MTHTNNTIKPSGWRIFKDRLRDLYLTIGFHIYLLQLENYELRRYWRALLAARYFPRVYPWRKSIIWTPKLLAVVLLAALQHIAFGFLFAYYITFFNVPYVGLVVFCIFYPIFLSLAVAILWPLDFIIKYALISRAKIKIKQFTNLKIIAIAGSYGKTTVKEFTTAVLKEKFNVLVTPENINTPIGIARLILKSLSEKTEILVVEMGEYYRGDVAEICALTPPDIAVVTGINEAHLERLKTLQNTVATIFEAVEYSKPNSQVVLNADDENIQKFYLAHAQNHKITWYSYKNNSKNQFPTKLLGRYALGSADAAVAVGRWLGVGEEAIKRGIGHVEPIEHRLQPIQGASGVLIIDDSYNGNPAGVSEAIRVLAQYPDRRKIFLTPGLVEMGSRAQELHEEIGRELALVANIVILIKNSATPDIAKGLEAKGFVKTQIIWFNSALEAHAGLKDILKPGDVILFQNDWGDNYV